MSSEKSFGLTFSVIFFILAAWNYSEKKMAIILIIFSLSFLIVCLIKPYWLKPLNIIWYRFGLLISRFSNPVILLLIYIVVVTPFALVARIFGYDPMSIRKNKRSLWVSRDWDEKHYNRNLRNQF